MQPSLTYVFCLVRSARKPALPALPGRAGQPGVAMALPGAGELRVLKAGTGQWLIVTSVPARGYDEAALADGLQDLDWVGPRALAHEAMVEAFLGAPAVLPMQLFTLFTSDERAVAHVERQQRQIGRILARIDRHHEWGLRLTLDEKAARAASAETSKGRRRSPSGAEYLVRKRDLLTVNRATLAAAKADANRLYRAMAAVATDATRRSSLERAAPGARLLLDAAFLVPVRKAAAFRAALRREAGKLDGRGVVVSLTGPWPPYNFI